MHYCTNTVDLNFQSRVNEGIDLEREKGLKKEIDLGREKDLERGKFFHCTMFILYVICVFRSRRKGHSRSRSRSRDRGKRRDRSRERSRSRERDSSRKSGVREKDKDSSKKREGVSVSFIYRNFRTVILISYRNCLAFCSTKLVLVVG